MVWQRDRYCTAAYRKRLYRRLRRKLVIEMGNYCAYCGKRKTLQFHHTAKRDWVARKTSRLRRIALYRRDWLRGILALACYECNQQVGTSEWENPEPFF